MAELKTVAIFGGTFDPVHNGHVQSALELKQILQLDELRLLPCHIPPHRQSPGASSEHRLNMVQLALAGSDLTVDDRELRRQRPSYSVETLELLRQELGEYVSLSWVMGVDAFAQLDSWHHWQDLLTLAHIIVMARPGEVLPTLGPIAQLKAQYQTEQADTLRQQAAGAIYCIELTQYPVSATEIRSGLAQRQWRDSDLPAGVLHYIQQHQLYADNEKP
ncbi:nicotinate-nucleotide adenylyltransferase [Oceanicoccus sp. KOV_DT_Chl]|uniref:nicotinate-nucleotide adenylyltransferase n=1 Tax=Oceanicoccus sp. KOV_DT_Chl TaxID=1904639 RepID=UPI000C7C20E2|nr:nicotinate-nucleotide adenylyltransferase [Oceanicoccus sp. KOV_DT_Chl]